MVALRKVHAVIPKDREELRELEEDLKRMGCAGLLRHPWRVRDDAMVAELITGKVEPEFKNTIRGRNEEWIPEMWGEVYGFEVGGEGMVGRKDDCTRGKFSRNFDGKYGYFIKDCKDERERRMLAFLVPILNPEKPYSLTRTLASTLLMAFSEERVVDWSQILRDLVQRLVLAARRGQPTYVGPFLFHLYHHGSTLTREEEALWEAHQFMVELQTTDSEPDEPQEDAKTVTVSDEERTVRKRRRSSPVEVSPPVRTFITPRSVSAGPFGTGKTSNPLEHIIRDLEGVQSQITDYEELLRQVEDLAGKPP